ncbi:uncharacterized protein N7515_001347 [Penicillium bovifimosum]|uniref:Uncharacterized protein n=1 Tax=Penicillium bovifimosum TaxID=126998 RepID=A0A9W9L723_9EURO|nr:uncharacterized protein N7515_001347 [Penicillium bovifimosum]KAJ5142560.1 hypothetical protein N7515_001347 [Penicillium bovifimosum]
MFGLGIIEVVKNEEFQLQTISAHLKDNAGLLIINEVGLDWSLEWTEAADVLRCGERHLHGYRSTQREGFSGKIGMRNAFMQYV